MSNETRDVTNEYRLADKASGEVDFAKEYPVQDVTRLIRAAWIHGYAAALLQHPNGDGKHGS
jgi:hypothetical protein